MQKPKSTKWGATDSPKTSPLPGTAAPACAVQTGQEDDTLSLAVDQFCGKLGADGSVLLWSDGRQAPILLCASGGSISGATMEALLAGQKPFRVKISGVAQFDQPNGHTIYLKVQNPEPIAELGKVLKTSVSPHLKLARRLKSETVNKLEPYLATLNFEAEWTCTEVVLLRKLMSEKEKGFREKFRVLLED